MAHESGRSDDGAARRAPLVLIIEDQEWSARALESILVPAGYTVVRAYDGAFGYERAVALRPDAILIDVALPDTSGIDLCRALVADPRVGPATPMLITTAEAPTQHRRMDALHAGAWEFVPLPPEAAELLAQLATWVRAKREIDSVRDAGLVDSETGFYNLRGLVQRVVEIAAEAARFEKPLSCVVFSLQLANAAPGTDLGAAQLADIAAALRATLRSCDLVGFIPTDRFGVVAPATGVAGAHGLAERVITHFDRTVLDGVPLRVHAGLYGVDNVRAAMITPEKLLERAGLAAEQRALALNASGRIHAYRHSH